MGCRRRGQWPDPGPTFQVAAGPNPVSCACPPDGKLKTTNVALFFIFLTLPFSPTFFLYSFFFSFFFFVNARIQGHCQKHIPHNQTSDGDSFPTACVSENSEIIPMFQRQVPWCSSRGQPGSGPCSLLFVPAFAEFLALDTIQPAFSIVCHVTYGSSAPNVCMYPENAAFHYVFSM